MSLQPPQAYKKSHQYNDKYRCNDYHPLVFAPPGGFLFFGVLESVESLGLLCCYLGLSGASVHTVVELNEPVLEGAAAGEWHGFLFHIGAVVKAALWTGHQDFEGVQEIGECLFFLWGGIFREGKAACVQKIPQFRAPFRFSHCSTHLYNMI